jgi:hypothetical protein
VELRVFVMPVTLPMFTILTIIRPSRQFPGKLR